MRVTPRVLLIARAVAILLVGLGAGSTARLIARLTLDPDMWASVWERRAGGPIAIVANLLEPWFDALSSRFFWGTSGSAFVATIIGALLLFRTEPVLSCCPRWVVK